MKSIRLVFALAAIVACASVATSQATTHVKHSAKSAHAQMAGGAACSDPGKCGGACSHAAAAGMTTKSASITTKSGACSGVDPSKCPASCRPDGATAVAANTRH